MRRAIRLGLTSLAAIVLISVVAIGSLLWWSLPPAHQSAAIPGLSAPVTIGFDDNGIPRIQAATPLDAAAAIGFVHARDRLFQMDLMRRAASGRLSELAGPATIRIDRTMRILGLRRRAEADLATLAPDTRAMLDAYSRGVNAWIALRGRFAAPEFIPLGPPEPWSPVDSLLWGKTMDLYLAGNWRADIARAALLTRLPPDQVRGLWPPQAATNAAIEAGTRMARAVPDFPEPFTLPAQASNEWASDAAHSVTGAPLLAGDPHLGYAFPAIWYLARIDIPGFTLAGATAPGVPFLIIGQNGHIAWTFTTTGADTQDVFIETPAPGGYATPTGPQPFITRTETIHVRGAPDITLQTRETRHGPLLSDVDDPPASPPGPLLAIAMASLQTPDTAATGLLALNRATTLAEAAPAATAISAPVQNLLVADRQHIGRFTTGRIPLRRAGDGTLPVDGADGAHDWTGFASGDSLPHTVDPPSGLIVNANERTAPPDFPVFMGQDWFGDWRARRIRALLDTRTTQSLQGFAQMQLDAVSTLAQAVLPRLLRTPPADPASRAALSSLARWNGDMRIDLSQPLLFNEWMRRLADALLARDHLPPFAEGAQADMLARALGPEEPAWCGPDCDATLARTLAAAAADPQAETWGDVHLAEFAHPLLGRLPVLGRLFTSTIPQPGDANTIFAGASFPPGWAALHGPAYRGIYDLANPANSLFALAPGQSGNPLRKQATSLLHPWRDGTTLKLGPIADPAETIDLHP